jgi:hypothetical protein
MVDFKNDLQSRVGRHNELVNQMRNAPGSSQAMQFYGIEPMAPVGIPQSEIDHLKQLGDKATPAIKAGFDKHFNQPGAADYFLGGTPNGGSPFPQAGR